MAFDRAEGLLRPGDRVLAAVSGGPDSVCLAHHLSRLSAKRRLTLALVHFHHGLRGREADLDAAFVRALAARLGAAYLERGLQVARTSLAEGRSLEDAGRALRYRALAELARKGRFDKVATGHQLDDQAETLLLHLLRGTKAKGLAGIPVKRPLIQRVMVIRPLLVLTRKEVLAYLQAYGLDYRKDKSNSSEKFTRNWVRARLLPLLEEKSPRIREHLFALAADIRDSLS
jgi:tRNA(Ile)-lysidine synthase